jgi:ribosomal protein L11 methyltransferase
MSDTEYVSLRISATPETGEMAMAWLVEQGFEGFEEIEGGFVGFVPRQHYDPEAVQALLASLPGTQLLAAEGVPDINWNSAWESAYEPIEVEDFCQVVASFHEPAPGFAYTLRIHPKMSFGTGHHPTTRLMIRQMRQLPMAGLRVLDMGCGTGILAILARMMGSGETHGIDVDRWSYDNASDNAELNGVTDIHWAQGDAAAIPPEPFDLILANINRNVLLADMPTYAAHLAPGGHLVLSGFLEEDVPSIEAATQAVKLSWLRQLEEGEWRSATVMHKPPAAETR